MASVFSSQQIRQLPDSHKIIGGFRDHINGNTPSYFGRDVSYDHPNTPPVVREYLRHIHICNPIQNHPLQWNVINNPYRRVNAQNQPQNDFVLVYWHDAINDSYYLLMIIGPDAHNNDKWMSMLVKLAESARKKDLNLK